MDLNDWLNMQIGELRTIDVAAEVRRVPGGWVYASRSGQGSTYVPLPEFERYHLARENPPRVPLV